LGTAIHVVSKRLIVRGDAVVGESRLPRVNSPVVDQKRVRIGRVYDIFGPISQPYLVIKPNPGVDAAVHVGKKLYVEETSRRDGKWKR
jgi:RNA-binding protein